MCSTLSAVKIKGFRHTILKDLLWILCAKCEQQDAIEEELLEYLIH